MPKFFPTIIPINASAAFGNPTSYQNAPFTFDAENRATGFAGMLAANYDADDLRAWKQSPGEPATYFVYDGDTLLLEEQMTGSPAQTTVLNAYGWGADGLRQRSLTGNTYYQYAYDPQGSPLHRYLSGSTSNAYLDTSVYDAFGALGADRDATQNLPSPRRDSIGFGAQYGYYTDLDNNANYSTGLVLMTHRYYDAGTGRFINRDPIGYVGGASLYGFAGGTPVNRTDPSGTRTDPDGTGSLVDGLQAFGVKLVLDTMRPYVLRFLEGVADAGTTTAASSSPDPGT